MTNDLSKLNAPGSGLSAGGNTTRVLDQVFQMLAPEDQKKLLVRAAELALEQEVKDLNAQRNFNASGSEMKQHIEMAKEHEKLKSDFTIQSEFKTASGTTTVRVSKANNTLYIVIAVVIAVVFFVMFSR